MKIAMVETWVDIKMEYSLKKFFSVFINLKIKIKWVIIKNIKNQQPKIVL